MKRKNKVIAICGPTASGKTSLAIEIAKYLNSEIISADSRQIYKRFDIATAKPSVEERQGINHHMVDIVEPVEEFTVADFADKASKIIDNIAINNKIPVVAGGTGLYFRILLENFDLPRVEPDKEYRQKLENIADEEGVAKLYSILEYADNELAKKIHPNNTVKIIRALEVCHKLNMPMSQAQGKKDPIYDVLWIGLNNENREDLYERINLRVDKMIEQGLEQEAEKLYKEYKDLPLLRATIGYQEFIEFFNNKLSRTEAIDKIKQNSRHYAKRQLTWFRQNHNINWFNSCNTDAKEIKHLINNFM